MNDITVHKIILKVTPGARTNTILGWEDGPYDQKLLKIHITTAPDKGKANKALIAFLAKEWGLPKNAFTMLSGETNRLKIIEIQISQDTKIPAEILQGGY